MRQIFLSYHPSDEAFTAQLADDLNAHGINVWMDIRNARPGRHWARSIERALSESNIMIVVLSPEALESRQVAAEWQAYLEAYRPVLPVVVVDCDLPGPLRTRRPIDFTRERLYNRSFHDLINRLIDVNSRIRRQEPVIWSTADGEWDDARPEAAHDVDPEAYNTEALPDDESHETQSDYLRRLAQGLRDLPGD